MAACSARSDAGDGDVGHVDVIVTAPGRPTRPPTRRALSLVYPVLLAARAEIFGSFSTLVLYVSPAASCSRGRSPAALDLGGHTDGVEDCSGDRERRGGAGHPAYRHQGLGPHPGPVGAGALA